MLKILEIPLAWGHAEAGGVVSVVRDLIAELGPAHRVILLVSDWSAPRPAMGEPEPGCEHYRLRLAGPPESLAAIRRLIAFPVHFALSVARFRSFCREHGVDIIHLHYLNPQHLVPVCARLLGGPPVVITIHRGDVVELADEPVVARWAKRFAARRADRLVAVSGWLAETAARAIGRVTRPSVIYNGFTLPAPSGDGAEDAARAPDRLPEDYAVMVANVRPYKGHDIALAAWRMLKTREEMIPLVIVGGGPGLQEAKDRAAALGLDETEVRFLGSRPRPETLDIIRNAALYIAPSRNEGFGIVIIEAGGLGVPVVCSAIGPFMEIIVGEANGYIFPADDAAGLADKVAEALSDRDEAGRRAERLRERVTECFTRQAMGRTYEALFLDIAGS
jgi:glycosyltransferase involved in cell wall biosynthesis